DPRLALPTRATGTPAVGREHRPSYLRARRADDDRLAGAARSGHPTLLERARKYGRVRVARADGPSDPLGVRATVHVLACEERAAVSGQRDLRLELAWWHGVRFLGAYTTPPSPDSERGSPRPASAGRSFLR